MPTKIHLHIMNTINLNQSVTELDGKAMPKYHLGETLASFLANSSKGDPLKYLSWAESLFQKKSLTIDDSDLESLNTFIRSHDSMSNLVKGQVLRILQKASMQEKS